MTCGLDPPEAPTDFPVVAFDLDGTLAEGVWPDRGIGPVIPDGLALVHHYAELGHEIALYTARPRSDTPAIWNWIAAHGLPIHRVYTEKPSAGLLVDDRAWAPPYTRKTSDKEGPL